MKVIAQKGQIMFYCVQYLQVNRLSMPAVFMDLVNHGIKTRLPNLESRMIAVTGCRLTKLVTFIHPIRLHATQLHFTKRLD